METKTIRLPKGFDGIKEITELKLEFGNSDVESFTKEQYDQLMLVVDKIKEQRYLIEIEIDRDCHVRIFQLGIKVFKPTLIEALYDMCVEFANLKNKQDER